MTTFVNLNFLPVQNSADTIGVLTFNRPDEANAFNLEMIEETTRLLKTLKENHTHRISNTAHPVHTGRVRALILSSKGKHFSAGADLEWMKKASLLNFQDNLFEAVILQEMFDAFYHLPIPTLSLVKGAVYGGAVGLVAASDIVIADETARFCLSEVKLGLLPAVILPYLTSRIEMGALRRLSLSAQVFDVSYAEKIGLVDIVADKTSILKKALAEVNKLLEGSLESQAAVKKLLRKMLPLKIDHEVCEAIARIRVSPTGQEGLQAFFNKSKPSWSKTLSTDIEEQLVKFL